jgi:hypothetical protein
MEGLWDWRTTGLKLKERIPDLDSGNIVPSDGAAGVDSEANRPTGAAQLRLTTRNGHEKNFAENRP